MVATTAPATRKMLRTYYRQLNDSFPFFLKETWRHAGLPEPSRVQYDVAAWLAGGPPKRGIRGFRDLSKTWLTVAYILWRLRRNPNERVLLVSESGKHTEKTMHLCKGWINSVPFLRHLAPRPEIKHGDNKRKWRDSATILDVGPSEFARSPSIAAMGITGQLPGTRATIIIPDDVETKENTLTRDARTLLRDRVQEFEAILQPGGDIVYLGTPHHEDSLYDYLTASRDLKFHYVFRTWCVVYPDDPPQYNIPHLAPMYADDLRSGRAQPGDPVWPERFGQQWVDQLVVSLTMWLMQFMCISDLGRSHRYPLKLQDFIVYPCHRDKAPVSIAWGLKDHNGSTTIEDIDSVGFGADAYKNPIFVDKKWGKYHGCKAYIDPGGRGLDEMAWSITGQLHGYLYVKCVDGVSGGASVENLEKIALSLREHGADEVTVETNFGGDMLILLLEPVIQRLSLKPSEHPDFPNGWHCAILEDHAAGQKEVRIINALEPVMNQHRIVIDPNVAKDQVLARQLTRITRERNCLEHDDRVEALAANVKLWKTYLHQDAGLIAAQSDDQKRQHAADYWARHVVNQNDAPNWIQH